MCNWRNRRSNPPKYNWAVHTGPTTSSGTGPSGDHSAGGTGKELNSTSGCSVVIEGFLYRAKLWPFVKK